MSKVVTERSPRTLLESCMRLRNALYCNEPSFFTEEIVIDKDSVNVNRTSDNASKTGTGFILKEVETVMLEIRKDLDIVPDEGEYDTVPLMLRLRYHTDEIGKMLTGGTILHPNDGMTTISQLIKDINRLRMSVENDASSSCNIL